MTTESQRMISDCRRVADILARVSDKWTILILMALGDRRMRFGELHRAVDGISGRDRLVGRYSQGRPIRNAVSQAA